MSSPAASPGFMSQTVMNWVIGLSIAGLYAALFIMWRYRKPKTTLADVLQATDFNNADQCNTIFNRLMTSAQQCAPYAGTSLCKACQQGEMKPFCDNPSIAAFCRSKQ